MGTTGGGATIAFTSHGAVASAKLISLSGLTISGVAVEDADLSSGVNKMIAGDLVTYSPIDATFTYDASLIDAGSLQVYDQNTLTIVLPADEDSAAATITATAFVTAISSPESANNERMVVSVTFQPTGAWTIT